MSRFGSAPPHVFVRSRLVWAYARDGARLSAPGIRRVPIADSARLMPGADERRLLLAEAIPVEFLHVNLRLARPLAEFANIAVRMERSPQSTPYHGPSDSDGMRGDREDRSEAYRAYVE